MPHFAVEFPSKPNTKLVSVSQNEEGDLVIRRYQGSKNMGEAVVALGSDPEVDLDGNAVRELIENYRTLQ
jgi:hypothetical protein